MTDDEVIENLASIVTNSNEKWTETVFGVTWNCANLPLGIGNCSLNGINTGVIAELYKHENIRFATLYVGKDYFDKVENPKGKFNFIKEKANLGEPVIIYSDEKYVSSAKDFNEGNCTVISVKEFLKI